MRHIIGVADMKICVNQGDTLVTHALGSCLGITAHDPSACVGGMLHVMLPDSKVNPEKAKTIPWMFVDTGVPAFFRELYTKGAVKQRIVVKVAGGAKIGATDRTDSFAIGKRNHIQLKKLFWKNGVLVQAADVGGNCPRTMYLDISSGDVTLAIKGEKITL